MTKLPAFSELLKSRLLLPGLVFFGVNSTFSYMFYQVNSFKIFLIAVGVTLMALWHDLIVPKTVGKRIPWKQLLIISIPLLATLPGYFWSQGFYNYNFRYEFVSNLVLVLWVAYLYRSVQEDKDLHPFLFLIGVTIIYAGGWAILEKFGIHPLKWGAIPEARPKSTFGNVNYFAGFLVVLIPMFFMLALPDKKPEFKGKDALRSLFSKANVFYLAVFLFAGTSLLFSSTRAAMAATALSLGLSVVLFLFAFIQGKFRKRLVISLICLFVLTVLILAILINTTTIIHNSRFGPLLTIQGWSPRLVAWQAAINSIKASPLIGFGLGSSYALYFKFADPNARLYHNEHSYNHVHSEFLEYFQESGVIGVILFFAFWGYLAFMMLRIIFTSDNGFYKKLAIGVLAGSLAFHAHGFFSVAPRMMVMKLPLFTMIGLGFILYKLYRSTPVDDSNTTISGRLVSFAPALIGLIVIWAMYIPWMQGQYKFVKLQRERPSLLKVEKLEKIVENHPDAYALDYLSHLQIQYRRPEQLQKTVDKIDVILPNYRELGHTKAILAVLQRDLQKAVKLGLQYQNEHDRYHKPTLYLMLGLAVDTRNYPLFKQQFEFLVRKLVFDSRLYYSLNASDVTVKIQPMSKPFEINNKKKGIEFIWNEKLVNSFYQTAVKNRVAKAFSTKDRQNFISSLAFFISRAPYFQIQIKEEYKSERNLVGEKMRTYFTVSQSLSQETQKLTMKHNKQLAMVKRAGHPELRKRQQEERQNLTKPLNDQIGEAAAYLRARTNWGEFLQRRGFVNTFIKDLITVVFPGQGQK